MLFEYHGPELSEKIGKKDSGAETGSFFPYTSKGAKELFQTNERATLEQVYSFRAKYKGYLSF